MVAWLKGYSLSCHSLGQIFTATVYGTKQQIALHGKSVKNSTDYNHSAHVFKHQDQCVMIPILNPTTFKTERKEKSFKHDVYNCDYVTITTITILPTNNNNRWYRQNNIALTIWTLGHVKFHIIPLNQPALSNRGPQT